MIALIQRVDRARVSVEDQTVGAIDRGLLALVCVQRGDSERESERLLERVLSYRLFDDAAGKMNRSLCDIQGDLLVVSQFTLTAETRKGNRPGFSLAATPEDGRRLFDHFVASARAAHPRVQTGEFGAHMKIESVNDGPVTFWLEVEPAAGRESRHGPATPR